MIRSTAACLLSLVVGLVAVAPAAVAAPPNPAVQLSALSCPSTGNCGAVGTYNDGLADTQGLLVTESHGRWHRAVEAQLPANAAPAPFKAANGGAMAGIACPAAGDCSAVGRYTDLRGIDHAVLFTESRGHWKRGIVARLPKNAITPAKPKKGSVTDTVGLAAISCSSVGNCVAVGNYETNAEVFEALIMVERNGHWGRGIEAPLPAGAPVAGQDAVLVAITCSAAGACTSAGKYVDASGHQEGLLVSGSGEKWTAAPAPGAPSDANSDPTIVPSSVSCVDAADCAAVGTYVNPLENSLGLLLTESGGAWAAGVGAQLPANAAPTTTVGDQTTVLASVACPQAGDCTAVGWYFDNDENGQGLLVGESGGVWQPGAEVTLPANAVGGLEKQSAGLDWISCPSLGNCLATGVYTDRGYNSQALLLSEVNGTWQTGVESPLPRNAGRTQFAAADQSSCTAVGDCTVIGQYNDGHANVLGFVISETNGSWGRPLELGLPPVNLSEVRRSLLTILKPHGKDATLARIRSAHRFVFTYESVEPGTATAAWYVGAGRHRVVIAAGRTHVDVAGPETLQLRLTAAGRKLLSSSKHLRVFAAVEFAPRSHDQRPQYAAYEFTLH